MAPKLVAAFQLGLTGGYFGDYFYFKVFLLFCN